MSSATLSPRSPPGSTPRAASSRSLAWATGYSESDEDLISPSDEAGWLLKKGTATQSDGLIQRALKVRWKRRYIIARASSLEWYAEVPPQGTRDGALGILKITSISTVQGEVEAGKGHVFVVTGLAAGAVAGLTLHADTSEEKAAWIVRLQTRIKSLKEDVSGPPPPLTPLSPPPPDPPAPPIDEAGNSTFSRFDAQAKADTFRKVWLCTTNQEREI